MNTGHAELDALPAAAPLFGLPDDRQAQLAARRIFVETKTCFLHAAADIGGHAGSVLLHQVRQARDVSDLWVLRSLILAALSPSHERTALHRHELRRSLEQLFPDTGTDTNFAPL